MKKLLTLTVLAALVAESAGCNCCSLCRRNDCPQPYEAANPCEPACAPACDPCGQPAMGAPMMAPPGMITPGPAYTTGYLPR
jgi:hypothetical protein